MCGRHIQRGWLESGYHRYCRRPDHTPHLLLGIPGWFPWQAWTKAAYDYTLRCAKFHSYQPPGEGWAEALQSTMDNSEGAGVGLDSVIII